MNIHIKYNLFGLSSLLSDYNIENEAYTIIDKEKNIYNLKTPFIAHLGSDFVVVKKIETNNVTYKWNGKLIKLNINNFNKSWTGVTLFAETNIKSNEPEYKQHKKTEIFEKLKLATLVMLTVLFLGYALIINEVNFSLWFFISLILNLSGLYVSLLLLQKQIYTESRLGDKICSFFLHADCNDILNTSAAKLFGLIKWSDIGLGYFISNIIILILVPSLIVFYIWISTFSLFYVFWSVWYQKFKAKQWCTLCLIVQVVFLLTVVSNLLLKQFKILEFSFFEIIELGSIYLLPTLVISILTPRISDNNLLLSTTQELNNIKANEDVFRLMLTKQLNYKVEIATSDIIFGNPKAKLFITILTNPHCNPCAKMHERAENLLDECGDNICIQYIFSSFDESLDASNKFLIAVYYQYDEKIREQTYNEWFLYGKNKKELFFEKYPVNIKEEIVKMQFKKHKKWKDENQIQSTPTILINGFKLPDNYKIEDLKFFKNSF